MDWRTHKMAIRTEYDALTGETVEIKLTASEIKEIEAQSAQIEADLAAREAEIAAKLSTKEAVLSKLGLTAEEAAALLA